ncbi:MAG TPA: putative Ig domain-containing protein, partial [Candidatus Saccharimonadales bacterium]|nr:putative Ig domain-containing protein [Candidatus Saccharimonadales bacterium]
AIELQKPDAPQTIPGPDFGLVPFITVDRVVYGDSSPWPTAPDGGGASLKRIAATLYGNDPANWSSGPPTPGAVNSTGPQNSPPLLAPIGNKSVNEGVTLSFTASATDTDTPPQTLTFTLDAGAPSGAGITPGGAFTWTPQENQGPGVYSITVRVTDTGAPILSDFETIQVTVNEVNSAPTLNPIGNKLGDEGSLITFTATAIDPDLPAQTLTYSLDPGAPDGASITAGGLFTWVPAETNGPGVYSVTVRVTDNGAPPRADTETITITVNEANNPPVLNPIGNKTVNEGVTLGFTATATDSDRPAQTLTFSLDPGAPAGAAITTSGVFSWNPTESQGPSTNQVTVRVTDNGTPPATAFEVITIIVNEVNTSPVLTVPGPQTINELATLTVTNTATDADLPPQALVFALVSAPTGVNLDPVTGVLTWTPNETQGGTTNAITLRVTDSGASSLSTTQSFTVVVNELNAAPVLNPIGNQSVQAGSLLTFTATATDSDLPAQSLRFTLDPGAPPGANLTTNGVFTWTPSAADGPSNYAVTVRVTDNGVPAMSDAETIHISVGVASIALVLVEITNTWRYVDTGPDLGTAWKEIGFGDASWLAGRALLYNETNITPAPKNTLLSLTNPAGGRVITYYFRTHFNLPADAAGVTLVSTNALDDGSVIYLNGTEAARINMNPGGVTAATFSASSWEATNFFVTNV